MNRTQKKPTATNPAPREAASRKAAPHKAARREPVREKTHVSPLRQRMIRDMELAGLVPGTRRVYIGAVVAIQDHYGLRHDNLSEKQVWWRASKTGPRRAGKSGPPVTKE